jgi:hypothetical membrane protein
LSTIAGVLCIATYWIFTAVAAATLDPPFSFATTWISDFGSPTLNPSRNAIFNGSTVAAAVISMLFYSGLLAWRGGRSEWQKLCLGVGCAAGLWAGVCMVMFGIYNEGYPDQHHFWAFYYFLMYPIVFASLAAALWTHPTFRKQTLVPGLAMLVFISLFALFPVPLWEWPTDLSFYAFIFAMAWNTLRIYHPPG